MRIQYLTLGLPITADHRAANSEKEATRENIIAAGYFRGKIFSREDIFAGRYFRGKIFSREQYIREKIFSRKYFKFTFREIFFPRK